MCWETEGETSRAQFKIKTISTGMGIPIIKWNSRKKKKDGRETVLSL